jgi:hypothetical protein
VLGQDLGYVVVGAIDIVIFLDSNGSVSQSVKVESARGWLVGKGRRRQTRQGGRVSPRKDREEKIEGRYSHWSRRCTANSTHAVERPSSITWAIDMVKRNGSAIRR